MRDAEHDSITISSRPRLVSKGTRWFEWGDWRANQLPRVPARVQDVGSIASQMQLLNNSDNDSGRWSICPCGLDTFSV